MGANPPGTVSPMVTAAPAVAAAAQNPVAMIAAQTDVLGKREVRATALLLFVLPTRRLRQLRRSPPGRDSGRARGIAYRAVAVYVADL